MALFGSSATADAADTNPETDRRKLVLAAVAGVALIAVVAFFLLPVILGGGSSTSEGSSSPLPRRAAAAPSTPSATPTPAFVLAPVAAYSDPFAPLPEEVAASAKAAAATASASPAPDSSSMGSTGTPSTASTASTGGSSNDATGTAGSGTASASTASTNNSPAVGKPVQVMAINGTSANIQIDSKSYAVKAGSTPVTGYTVKSVSNGTVVITHDGTARTLVVGEQQTF